MARGVFGCRLHRTHIISLLIVLCGLRRTRAQDVRCSVTQGPGWTTYSVPENDGTSCEYSWSNGSHVVATHQSETEPPVLEQSMNVLTIQTCSEQVHYKRDCISEGVSHEATCTATCYAEIHQGDRGPLIQIRHHACILVPALLVLLLGLSLSIRCWKHSRSNTEADVEAHG